MDTLFHAKHAQTADALGVEPIFGTDLNNRPLLEALAADLRGLLSAERRAYLTRKLADA